MTKYSKKVTSRDKPTTNQIAGHAGVRKVKAAQGTTTSSSTPTTQSNGLAAETTKTGGLSSHFQTAKDEIKKTKWRERFKMRWFSDELRQSPLPITTKCSECNTKVGESTEISDDTIVNATASWKINDIDSNTDPVYSRQTRGTSQLYKPMLREGRETLNFKNPLYETACGARKRRIIARPLGYRVKQCGILKMSAQEDKEAENTEVLKIADPTLTHTASPRSGQHMSVDDERECLAQALQSNIVQLVDRIQFSYSDLPEQMISGGHITEDECRKIRDDFSRKDQVRYLISRTKGRSLSDMQTFLELIDKEAPDVVKKIKDKFEENKRKNVKCTTCALCQCFNIIDIKDVVDNLWSEQAIPDGFYNEVVACTKPRGSQTNLWNRLLDFLNSKQNQERKELFENLFRSILSRGKFDFLVKPMQRMVNTDKVLKCNCFLVRKTSLLKRYNNTSSNHYDSLSSCSPRSSYSERQSSTLSRELNQDFETVERTITEQDNQQMRTLKQTVFVSAEDTSIKRKTSMHGAVLETITEEHNCKSEGERTRDICEHNSDMICLRPKVRAAKPEGAYDSDDTWKTEALADKSKRCGRNLDELYAVLSAHSTIV